MSAIKYLKVSKEIKVKMLLILEGIKFLVNATKMQGILNQIIQNHMDWIISELYYFYILSIF